MAENITYSAAIRKVMQDNGGFAPLKLLYEKIWNYKDKSQIHGLMPDKTGSGTLLVKKVNNLIL